MNKNIILEYLNKKTNEKELLEYLNEQKKIFTNNLDLVKIHDDEYFKLIFRLINSSSGKLKYHTLLLLSKIGFSLNPKNFKEMTKIAINNSIAEDGNVRYANYLLVEKLDFFIKILPMFTKYNEISYDDVHIFYESFRDIFYELYNNYYEQKNAKIKKSLLKSLAIIIPKIHDMAKFHNDKDEIEMINELQIENMSNENRKK